MKYTTRLSTAGGIQLRRARQGDRRALRTLVSSLAELPDGASLPDGEAKQVLQALGLEPDASIGQIVDALVALYGKPGPADAPAVAAMLRRGCKCGSRSPRCKAPAGECHDCQRHIRTTGRRGALQHGMPQRL